MRYAHFLVSPYWLVLGDAYKPAGIIDSGARPPSPTTWKQNTFAFAPFY